MLTTTPAASSTNPGFRLPAAASRPPAIHRRRQPRRRSPAHHRFNPARPAMLLRSLASPPVEPPPLPVLRLPPTSLLLDPPAMEAPNPEALSYGPPPPPPPRPVATSPPATAPTVCPLAFSRHWSPHPTNPNPNLTHRRLDHPPGRWRPRRRSLPPPTGLPPGRQGQRQ
jgi:hypothetical protein